MYIPSLAIVTKSVSVKHGKVFTNARFSYLIILYLLRSKLESKSTKEVREGMDDS